MTLRDLIRLMREIAFLGVLVYLSIKLFSGELSLDFAKLSSTELVNLLLAFFSIALSAAFYFAATSQSNQFYDNVNKFSKETSELLGRLDEQVKGIGGRQTELKDSIDKHYYSGKGRDTEKGEKGGMLEEVEKLQDKLSTLVSGILDKTNLTAAERASLEAQLKEKDAELGALRENIGRETSRIEPRVRNHTRRKLKEMGIENIIDARPEELLFQLTRKGHPAYINDLIKLKYLTGKDVDSPKNVTESGKQMVLSVLDSLTE